MEKIGRVKLDYSRYLGEDLYCDGAVEDEILDIVKTRSAAEYADIIVKRKNWPILYHLSRLRESRRDTAPWEAISSWDKPSPEENASSWDKLSPEESASSWDKPSPEGPAGEMTSLGSDSMGGGSRGSRPKVLEVGSGCGAITGALSRKAGSVTCVDLSKKRSMINAYRHRECENITIHVGNFKDIEPHLPRDYDFIFLIGVFEYGQSAQDPAC